MAARWLDGPSLDELCTKLSGGQPGSSLHGLAARLSAGQIRARRVDGAREVHRSSLKAPVRT